MSGATHDPQPTLQPAWLDEDFRIEADRVARTVMPLVAPLQAMFGPQSEVVLHDFGRLPNTVVAIAGTISGRVVGAPTTDFGLSELVSERPPSNMLGYRTQMPGGIICRSSTLFLHGDRDRPVAALCINIDIRGFEAAREVLDGFLSAWTPAPVEPETFHADVGTLSEDILVQAITAVAVPVDEMNKAQKLRVVRELDRRGFFLIREAADLAAAALGVTRFTVYNYLNEIR